MTRRRLLLLAIGGPAAVGAMVFLIEAVRRIFVPYELDYGEGIVMWQAAHVISPSHAYHPISEPPFIVFHYTPLYQLVSWAVAHVVGDLQVAGRAVSFAGFLITEVAVCVLVARTAARRWSPLVRWGSGVTAALLAANLATIQGWVPVLRVDMLGLGLTFTGLALYFGGGNRYLAFVCFTAAVFTKQTLIAAPLACALVGLAVDWRRTIREVGAAVALGGLATAALEVATRGQFLRHTFTYNQNPFSARQAAEMIGANVLSILPVLPIGLAAIAFAVSPALRSERAWRDVLRHSRWRRTTVGCGLLLGISFLISLSVGKVGANMNYFLEWNLACCVLAGLAIGMLLASRSARRGVMLGILAAALTGIYVVPRLGTMVNKAFTLTAGARQMAQQTRADFEQLLRTVESIPGPIVSYEMTVLVKAHRDIPIEPGIMFTLARTGGWDERPFVERLDRGEYAAVILPSTAESDGLLTEAIERAITSRYRETDRIGVYHIYRPVDGNHSVEDAR